MVPINQPLNQYRQRYLCNHTYIVYRESETKTKNKIKNKNKIKRLKAKDSEKSGKNH